MCCVTATQLEWRQSTTRTWPSSRGQLEGIGSVVILLDDRLLIEHLLVGLDVPDHAGPATTTYWYYRACRAAVLGAGGHLSGPFLGLPPAEQEEAVLSLLELPDAIALPDARSTIPLMARLARRHTRLNLMNLEAVAAARLMGATVWLSPESAAGLLPAVLDSEALAWVRVDTPGE